MINVYVDQPVRRLAQQDTDVHGLPVWEACIKLVDTETPSLPAFRLVALAAMGNRYHMPAALGVPLCGLPCS
jgi:hypothetical protein